MLQHQGSTKHVLQRVASAWSRFPAGKPYPSLAGHASARLQAPHEPSTCTEPMSLLPQRVPCVRLSPATQSTGLCSSFSITLQTQCYSPRQEPKMPGTPTQCSVY